MNDPFPDEIDEALWDEACRRADAIREFLKGRTGNATAAQVAELAAEMEVSQATAYRLIKLFRSGGTVLSLVGRKRGRPEGHRVLDDQREQIVRSTITAYYLKRTRPTVSQLVRDVQTNCISVGVKPPHRRTIVARLRDIDLQKRAKRRGEQKIVKATTAVPGALGASRPLKIVQIDHTKADVFVVDEENRQPVGRPWLTLAMDVCSRMVTGFYLTMDAPSRLSTSLCLLHSVFDKSAWLREREITEPWPVAGLPDLLHVDNGADFRSRAFKRGCQDASVAIEWRPPGEPRFGGHIERLIGTQMGKLHLLPGTTFSNEQELGEYDSKRHAALTLRELEHYLALDIVGSYHQSIHSSLGRPPLAVWRDHEGKIPLRLPKDRLRFWLTFLPEEERTLRPTGIHLFGLRYWSAALSADVGRSDRRLLVKYDPRDMARVFVRRPSGNFVEARYADVTLPSITLHEAVTARRTLLAKGRREVDTRTIVRTAIAQRELIEAATRKTAAARRGKASSKSKVDDRGWGSLRGVDSSKPVPFVEDTD
ncbi:DDE-type integrase/transposase/recombinase (plasmid) [Mesorhizobium sp. NBSH29]|uniref:Mu transposase C-terminal domain-containing protein n=1 Tax=Mesorhizobium sp. NBSH29 TaxID=2654249 RepID=UPI0018966A67|nr:Mu transposase C-terminal domain-containing protein [Mesorhizobium sp. NBSH29]QPC88868.1 DDE-type integrase/transposase/recombinase [Mesorhizobium sp. NBSH29]QPC89076.1 DDE-type integrase/transposase/recombinase [Mesorhizobium sp. NBSH29]